MSGHMAILFIILSALLARSLPAAELTDGSGYPGQRIYQQHCAHCHDRPRQTRSRSRQSLASIPQPLIVYALTEGKMQAQGQLLEEAQINSVANYLVGLTAPVTWEAGAGCAKPARPFTPNPGALSAGNA